MKYKSLFLLLILVFLSSCKEKIYYQIYTSLFPDGSIERRIVARSDSTTALNYSLPEKDSANWEKSFKQDPDKEKGWVLDAKRKFSNVDSLNAVFYSPEDTSGELNRKLEVKKRFRWFYTYFEYRETYFSLFPFRGVPLDKYLDHNDIKLLYARDDEEIVFDHNKDSLYVVKKGENRPMMTGADSAEVERRGQMLWGKLLKWRSISTFHEFVRLMEEANQQGETRRINPDILKEWRSTVVQRIERIPINDLDLFAEQTPDSLHLLDPGDSLYMVTIMDELRGLIPKDGEHTLKIADSKLESFRRKIANNKLFSNQDDYENTVNMPGLLIDSNGEAIEGNNVHWKVPETINYITFEMWAESRVTNPWALWITGIFVLLFLFSIFLLMQKRKRNT